MEKEKEIMRQCDKEVGELRELRKGLLRIFCFEGTPRPFLVRLVDANRARFKLHFGEISINEEDLPVPRDAYDENRQQYEARFFLQALGNLTKNSNHALGIVDLDLFVPDLNFIFGSAEFGGNTIVALPRLRQSFYDLPDDDDLFFQRTVKEIFHELGHVLGLRHCRNHCVMRFSNSLMDTDDKPDKYCTACLDRLE